MPHDPWRAPPSRAAHAAEGKVERGRVPRSALAHLVRTGRDPMAVLDAQDVDRVPELVPLRTARMGASAFAFYRGSAAIMADDLSRCPSTNILVASCGDAHLSNFSLYASPQRTLVFDLNDFDESAWAPSEWDVKRLATSVVIAGRATSRDDSVIEDAARQAVRTYQRALCAAAKRSPLERYFDHFDALGAHLSSDPETAAVVDPPVMTHLPSGAEARAWRVFEEYQLSVNVDIRLLLQKYAMADVTARVVGVGSVGTRCLLIALQDGDGGVLLLQGKEAGESVLVEYGRVAQPPAVAGFIEEFGNGGRVVALQRILQAVSDPFLGHIRRSSEGALRDFYVRQFHDMKGGFDLEAMEDKPFRWYAVACAATLARAHGQSPAGATAAGYSGDGGRFAEAVVEWAYAYADLSYEDWQTFRRHRAIDA
ncbi:DUF2252 domain-containing protein [Microbacterium kunmingense]|uniref:DUF2252 domain-containing protein n=1 Tax=Microbacterium kunmingense TaxID=2915939 RepID=UPI002003CE47|nr:DUF2252 domain-containing protein [Microbacterium kunmingense]